MWVKSNLGTRSLALDLTGSHAVAHGRKNAPLAFKTYKQDSVLQKGHFLSCKKWLHILFTLDPQPDLVFVLQIFFGLFLSRGVISADDSTVIMSRTSVTL